MRESCFYTCQPLEKSSEVGLKATFEMIHSAETQLLYASDWPHFDFDAPRVIYSPIDIPFLSEDQKRNILGRNAARVFNLPSKAGARKAA